MQEGLTMDNQTKKLLLLALSGDATAQNDLGCAYSSGQGVEQDFAEAIKWWRKAADCDLPGAALNLGLAYLSGQGVPQDYTEAARWNRKAAEQGLAGAEHNLGNAYFKGQGVPQNYTEAVKWYRRAAYQGLAASQYSLGLAYANGNGVGQDYLEAARWYLKSAEQGDVDAQYNLAGLYAQGLGVAQDLAEAEKWWIKAAAQGDDQAKKCLQALYSAAAGQNSSGRSPAGSPGHTGGGSSGSHGHEDSDELLKRGIDYFYGNSGLRQDYSEAMRLWRRAAELGNAEAQFRLALDGYDQGRGLAQNYEEAAIWYRKAAEQGRADAQSSLGFLYLCGRGVKKDGAEAVKWFRMAAGQGDSSAQYELGEIYHRGMGVERDDAEALKWYRMAAEQGDTAAKEELSKLETGETSPSSDNSRSNSLGNFQSYSRNRDRYQGRIGRQKFWCSQVIVISIALAILIILFPIWLNREPWEHSAYIDDYAFIRGVLYVVECLSSLCLFLSFILGMMLLSAFAEASWGRRAHDLGLDGECADLKACWAYASLVADACLYAELSGSGHFSLIVVILLFTWAASGWYLWFRYGFLEGIEGSNKYGPDPTKKRY